MHACLSRGAPKDVVFNAAAGCVHLDVPGPGQCQGRQGTHEGSLRAAPACEQTVAAHPGAVRPCALVLLRSGHQFPAAPRTFCVRILGGQPHSLLCSHISSLPTAHR